MQIPMFRMTVKARVISMMTRVNARTIYIRQHFTTTRGDLTMSQTEAKKRPKQHTTRRR